MHASNCPPAPRHVRAPRHTRLGCQSRACSYCRHWHRDAAKGHATPLPAAGPGVGDGRCGARPVRCGWGPEQPPGVAATATAATAQHRAPVCHATRWQPANSAANRGQAGMRRPGTEEPEGRLGWEEEAPAGWARAGVTTGWARAMAVVARGLGLGSGDSGGGSRTPRPACALTLQRTHAVASAHTPASHS